jgi:hypothetical protein
MQAINREERSMKSTLRLIARTRFPRGFTRRFPTRAGTAATLMLLMSLATAAPASAQTMQWTRQVGFPGFDVVRGVGADGTGVYALGAISGALPGQTYAGGSNDVFLRRYDAAGNELWTRQFGTPERDFPSAAVAIDEEKSALYVGGETNGSLAPGVPNMGDADAFVRRYDTAGNMVWTDQFGSSHFDGLEGVAFHGGKLFVAGNTLGALPGQVGGGSSDGWVRAYDSEGDALWTRQFGGAGSEDFHWVAADRTGVYLAGSIAPGPDFTGDNDVLVVKYDFAGGLLWVRQFGTTEFDHGEGIAPRHGEIYVSGQTAGTLPEQMSAGGIDNFVRKYGPDGTVAWTRQFGTPGDDTGGPRRVIASGRGIYVTGTVASALPDQTSAGGIDVFARQYDRDGDELWTLQFGTSGNEAALSADVGENDEIYLSGRTSGAFPGSTNAGGQDGYLAKIAR